MTNNANRSAKPPVSSAEDLKRLFDAGVRADLSAKPLKQRTPIVEGRAHPGAEKRALSDAARALAQLWKISPHPVR